MFLSSHFIKFDHSLWFYRDGKLCSARSGANSGVSVDRWHLCRWVTVGKSVMIIWMFCEMLYIMLLILYMTFSFWVKEKCFHWTGFYDLYHAKNCNCDFSIMTMRVFRSFRVFRVLEEEGIIYSMCSHALGLVLVDSCFLWPCSPLLIVSLYFIWL